MSLADDLKAAKRWLSSPRRWTKGSFFEGENRDKAKCACAMGACMIAAGGSYQTNYNNMVNALSAQLPELYLTIPAFNDDPATTFEDVHALFDRAIAHEESQS